MRLDELDHGRFHHFNSPYFWYSILIGAEGLLNIFTSIGRETVENSFESANIDKSNVVDRPAISMAPLPIRH